MLCFVQSYALFNNNISIMSKFQYTKTYMEFWWNKIEIKFFTWDSLTNNTNNQI